MCVAMLVFQFQVVEYIFEYFPVLRFRINLPDLVKITEIDTMIYIHYP